ncbi:hypothetical protein NVD72_004418 [Salmonella enterica]|uniref:Uncharacterized protein n=2 Tax=Epseptimavirus TaxID=2732017 RepID=A0A0A0RR00_9CAUD|nr:hypothetical protein CPT_Stitch8 [Salmonella phage Stitch]YP_009146114.1 hypothetical protein CPT_Stitch173 [Salmonella phage Stitch]YP_009812144.1 hypothetical protein HOU17_gp008 [Salmonella phage Sw2]YP_010678720.1 hypothetical protein PQE64_gp092 [Salmonella phage vB_STy-RN29]EJO9850666.1 hypothetical protein [Salmonella enterica]QCQ65324.1 hypothetical protein CPT_Seabear_008 [Salmonella phage Seabear]AIW03959.1 hypothetical protein CPT_Stitch8 [Salmonella phage Stitch]AIW04124.1 hyp
MIKSKNALVISAKPASALDSRTKKLLTVAQRSVKYRFKQYKKGKQQGLEMVWRNIMIDLYNSHQIEKSLKNA